ncbi:MAG: hypothetical protein ACI87N_000620 [Flavobacteriales bacterium]
MIPIVFCQVLLNNSCFKIIIITLLSTVAFNSYSKYCVMLFRQSAVWLNGRFNAV